MPEIYVASRATLLRYLSRQLARTSPATVAAVFNSLFRGAACVCRAGRRPVFAASRRSGLEHPGPARGTGPGIYSRHRTPGRLKDGSPALAQHLPTGLTS